jgi:hypothetical protein
MLITGIVVAFAATALAITLLLLRLADEAESVTLDDGASQAIDPAARARDR